MVASLSKGTQHAYRWVWVLTVEIPFCKRRSRAVSGVGTKPNVFHSLLSSDTLCRDFHSVYCVGDKLRAQTTGYNGPRLIFRGEEVVTGLSGNWR